MDWCRRHLNWTLFGAYAGGYSAFIGAISLYGYYVIPDVPLFELPEIPLTAWLIAVSIELSIVIPATIWHLRQKGRRLAWVGMIFVPFGGWVIISLKNHRERAALLKLPHQILEPQRQSPAKGEEVK